MSCSSNDKIREFHRPEAPHFVKFYLEFPDKGVQIPRKFMNKMGDDSLGKVVILKDAVGKEWPVELIKNDEGIWLRKGWEEFQDFYSLGRFYFLVFRYDGNSQFFVTICDRTTTEIDYPITSPRRVNEAAGMKNIDGEGEEEEEEMDNSCVERSEEEEEGENGNEIVSVDQQIAPYGEPNPGISRGFATALRLLRRTTNGGQSSKGLSRIAPPRSLKPCPENGNDAVAAPVSALDRAKLFKSENGNPFFISPIRTYSVTKGFRVNIPKYFVKLYLSKNRIDFYELRPADRRKRSWNGRLVTEKNNCGRIAGGWKRFALENKVAVGNVCIFEMLQGEKTFVVHVYR